MNKLPLRLAASSAVVAFTAGGLSAAWLTWHRDFLLEFQAGQESGLAERLIAIAQSASIEGLGFGGVALLFGVVALVAARRTSPEQRGELAAATFLLLAGALGGWLSVVWAAEDLLPFLSPLGLVLLNLSGFLTALTGLALFRSLARRLGLGRDAGPTARTLACLLVVFPAGFYVQELLVQERSTKNLALAGTLFLFALPTAAILARLLQPLVAWIARRGARGPLLPGRLGRVATLAFTVCVLASLPFVSLSPVPTEIEYGRVEKGADAPAGPNVVLVTVDTLRADRLGCYGYDRPTSPFLDSVAAQGTRFDDPVSAASWTKPATGTILTGLYPSRHGALYHGSKLKLPDDAQTLAEAFQEQGYVTAGFVSNPNIKAVFDFDRGFDVYFDTPVEDTLTRACIRSSLFGKMLMKLTRHQFNWKYENDVREMNRHVGAWLAENHDRPFFLYIHYIDPHIPYSPPAEYRDRFLRDHGFPVHNERKRLVGGDLYDGEIRYTDDGLRELVEGMQALGTWDDTLFAVTSDHGEEFFEHGVLGHGFSLYQPVLRVPLIFHGPNVPTGHVVDEPVQILDLAATLLDLAGCGIREFGDGHSVAEALADSGWKPAAEYFLENEFGQDDSNHREFVLTGIRSGRWKLVLTEQNAFFPPQHPDHGREALYDLEEDPEERENLITDEEHRELVSGLLERLQLHSRYLFTTGFRDVKPAALDPDIEASLRALGY